MPNVQVIAFCAVGQLGFWKSALDEIKETYPPLRNDASRRPRTYLPPLLPVREKMDEIYRFQLAVNQSIVFLLDNATNAEEVMVLRVIEWLARAQRNETGRMQRKIWTLDPERFRREIRDGYVHLADGEAVMGPDPRADAGANAGGNAGGN
ncbi:hypothetical protein FAGAP_7092 [Fusarium agapanthi]|uniref:Uncharacterized protein n=1 Tax=Fusarium agapanthi TaxID=1803897 RepID=A0A9P5BDQ1_9HYPO|nr:hypothetical protein FAGAP_7092 [Fusarium agapanthi]